MAIESELRTQILSSSEVTDIIGTELYPSVKPQNVKPPYAIYHIISDNDTQCMSGAITMSKVRVQIDCYSYKYSEVIQLRQAVKDSVIGFKASNSFNSYDGYDDETEFYKKILDFKIRN